MESSTNEGRCTPLSSSMMQAGVCLRRDTETTLPELTEQHRIRPKEEELSGVESESETECAAPGLNTVKPECVTAHSGVSDVHHMHISLIKVDTDLGSAHTVDFIKTVSLDNSTELGYVTLLHPDPIKTEADDGGYLKAEHSDFPGSMGFVIKPDQVKCESSETLVSDLSNTEMNGADVDRRGPTVPMDCAEELNTNCKKEDIHDLPTQCGDVNHHRIRQKEEELSGLESVHMAESETECAAPGLNTLEPECVTAHSGVGNVNHIHTSLIKIESDLGSTHTGDPKMEGLKMGSTELAYVTHLHPDQIKTEADDGGYLEAEHINDLPDVTAFIMKSDELKCESSETLVSDLMNTEISEAAVDHKDQTEPWQCAEELNTNCKKEDIHDLPTQSGDVNHHCDINNENNQTTIVQSSNKHIHCQGLNATIDSMVINSSKNPSSLNFLQKPFRCIQCEKCFNFKYDLDRHLRIHTRGKPHKCIHCGKCFSLTSYLNKHLRIHTGEKPYQCIHCGKCFSLTSYLHKHLKSHTGEKPYKCTKCETCFINKSGLDAHIRMHTGEKPYKCTHCDKCFSQSSNLHTHLRIHTGEKPYKCIHCGKCFPRISALNNHLRIHTAQAVIHVYTV